MSAGATAAAPASLLLAVAGDDEMARIFSLEAMVQSWLDVEVALAEAQHELGLISDAAVEAVRRVARPEHVDHDALWAESRNVGYPILPLLRQISARMGPGEPDMLHYGATTQDIMDTGLVLLLVRGLDRLDALALRLGDALARLVELHRDTVMAGRTHAQQAVPTTFGAKMAVFLSQVARLKRRLDFLRTDVAQVSLHGAAGTSAAFGPEAGRIREHVAARLGLEASPVPWHVARDRLAEVGLHCALLAAVSARLAREVVALSRTEIGEVAEGSGHHRGASSTMPQKRNPIGSEAVIGMAGAAEALASGVLRAVEHEHERSAGEWQVEWHVLPQLMVLSAGALNGIGDVCDHLDVFEAAMTANLEADHGLIMAEAHMIALVDEVGRQAAHDVVYAAATRSRDDGVPLGEALGSGSIAPSSYLGAARAACTSALEDWRTAAAPVARTGV
ncbi:MAG: 3-carboxy-cis,cis-muconate cycloisomerase [Thermoleophilaceae bacterium]|nr:3-carboxy-cis,cis-muconate cycloisomerase [Thermoleophilaceae bacterium]